MTLNSRIKEKQLKKLESEFEELLLACLKESAKGRWGLFGQNDIADPEHKYMSWQEADRLREIASQIQSVQREFGTENILCERFLYYRSLRRPNVKGEPRLAQEFLDEISAIQNRGAQSTLL